MTRRFASRFRFALLNTLVLYFFRSSSFNRETNLYPGAFHKKSFTEEILSKQVSKRGPYDLYSGKIGLKIRKNDGIGPGAYEVQSFTGIPRHFLLLDVNFRGLTERKQRQVQHEQVSVQSVEACQASTVSTPHSDWEIKPF